MNSNYSSWILPATDQIPRGQYHSWLVSYLMFYAQSTVIKSGSPQQLQRRPDETGSGEATPSALIQQVQVVQVCNLHLLWLWGTDPARWLRKEFRLSRPSARESFSASPTWGTRPTTGCGARLTPCRPIGTSSGNCEETETRMVRACHTPRQPVQNHPSGHLGGWAMPWSAEEMLDGQHQRVDNPAYAKTAHDGFLQKRLEEDLCWIVPRVPRRPYQSRDWTELKWLDRDHIKAKQNLLYHKHTSGSLYNYDTCHCMVEDDWEKRSWMYWESRN